MLHAVLVHTSHKRLKTRMSTVSEEIGRDGWRDTEARDWLSGKSQ